MAAAPVNTQSYHVCGPVVIEAGIGPLVGLEPSFVTVGVCEDGVDLEFRPFQSEIKSDGGGGPSGDAVEMIFLNYTIVARFALVPYAGAYVNKLRAISQANGAGVEGVMSLPGKLYGLNSNLPKFRYQAVWDVDGGFQMNSCVITRAGSMKASTRESKPQWEVRSINYFNPAQITSIVGNTLYSRI